MIKWLVQLIAALPPLKVPPDWVKVELKFRVPVVQVKVPACRVNAVEVFIVAPAVTVATASALFISNMGSGPLMVMACAPEPLISNFAPDQPALDPSKVEAITTSPFALIIPVVPLG